MTMVLVLDKLTPRNPWHILEALKKQQKKQKHQISEMVFNQNAKQQLYFRQKKFKQYNDNMIKNECYNSIRIKAQVNDKPKK